MSTDALRSVFARAGCDASAHVVALASGHEVGLEADETVVMASTFKVPVALAFYELAEAGEIDASRRVVIVPVDATPGPVGISKFEDPVEMSLRDLAFLMLTISDNAATDAVIQAIGVGYVNERLRAWGCARTTIESDLDTMLARVSTELGFASYSELQAAQLGERGEDARRRATDEPVIDKVAALAPASASRTTARDMTQLLGRIWADDIASPAACAALRRVMAQQVTRRMAAAVPEGGRLAAKSGGLFGRVRNEIGVVTHTDGANYAFAVFTRAHEPFRREATINAAMAEVVRTAIEALHDSGDA